MNNKCCKDCPNRVVGCHENCKKYAEFVKENNIRKEKERAIKQQEVPIFYNTKRII